MTKNSLYVTIALVGLGVAFGVLCFLVWVSRGHPGFIRHKLRIGAVMVTLTALLAGGVTHCNTKKCYAAPSDPDPRVYLTDLQQNGSLVVDSGVSTVVAGSVYYYYSARELYFRVVDDSTVTFQAGDVHATDGEFGGEIEGFEFTLSPDIPPGEYLLRFYWFPPDEQELYPDSYVEQFDLIVL
jgi:hypothetical protein